MVGSINGLPSVDVNVTGSTATVELNGKTFELSKTTTVVGISYAPRIVRDHLASCMRIGKLSNYSKKALTMCVIKRCYGMSIMKIIQAMNIYMYTIPYLLVASLPT